MTFENLPKNWSDQPLSDPSIAVDVVDLFISKADRRRGMFIVLLCDDRDRLLMPVAVDGLSGSGSVDDLGGIVDVGPEDCEVMLKPFLLAAQAGTDSGLLLAMGRFGPSDLPEIDEPWAEEAARLCREAGVRLIGFYVATADGVRRAEVGAVA
jgi:hypothetical protein